MNQSQEFISIYFLMLSVGIICIGCFLIMSLISFDRFKKNRQIIEDEAIIRDQKNKQIVNIDPDKGIINNILEPNSNKKAIIITGDTIPNQNLIAIGPTQLRLLLKQDIYPKYYQRHSDGRIIYIKYKKESDNRISISDELIERLEKSKIKQNPIVQ